jgi:Zn-dependent protease with chaperone function
MPPESVFQAVWFEPGGSDGRSCTLILSNFSLTIENSAGVRLEWPYRGLKLNKAGEEDAYLVISCPSLPGPVDSVAVRDPAFPALLAEKVSPALKETLSSFGKKRKTHVLRKWRNLAVAGLTAAAIFFGGYWVLNNWVSSWAAKNLPVKAEEKWGGVLLKSYLTGKKEITKGPAYEAAQLMLKRLKAAASKDVKYNFKVHVVDDPMVNAFALPGGHMVLMTGLMEKAESAEEVTGVLAHEMQHVIQRHVVKRLVQSMGWRVWFSLFFGGGDLGKIAFGMGNLMEISYGRSQESEADREGAKLLAAAGLPIEPLGRFFDRLSKKEGTSKMPSFLSSHPESKKRSEELKRLARELNPKTFRPLGLNWRKVRQSLGR